MQLILWVKVITLTLSVFIFTESGIHHYIVLYCITPNEYQIVVLYNFSSSLLHEILPSSENSKMEN
jgi:hypothetical protein